MPSFASSGLRSANTLDAQNVPTLLVVNEETTSGAAPTPARSARLILSSVMPPTALTWMFG